MESDTSNIAAANSSVSLRTESQRATTRTHDSGPDLLRESSLPPAKLTKVSAELNEVRGNRIHGNSEIDRSDLTTPARKSRDSIERVISDLNKEMKKNDRSVNFRIDKVTGSTIISVIDEGTGNIIKQIPPEVVLNVARNMTNYKGYLFDDNF